METRKSAICLGRYGHTRKHSDDKKKKNHIFIVVTKVFLKAVAYTTITSLLQDNESKKKLFFS